MTGPICMCGHFWLDHHGVDPKDGCLGNISWFNPCPCSLTATEVNPDE